MLTSTMISSNPKIQRRFILQRNTFISATFVLMAITGICCGAIGYDLGQKATGQECSK